ncbi:hypothetical protein EUX98_g8036 [Antrodiella citrinella]|uniref:AB hydrolase-1 domain-containing protein n=1 Tax=Antrodiella citrinella TaxID=2447956 RepID=A0A4S4MDZ9_9APHY|nr:hypothetical protein EUX98_g8036 [Antrodiella citrinella]
MSEYNLPDGEVAFTVPSGGKPCFTHYWISGDLKDTTKTPLIIAHGGPGCSHNYLAILSRLTQTHGIPVILYDQLGNGLSTHLAEKNGDTEFWTIQLFIDELDNLISHLKLSEYDLLGHSWGGILGSSFAVRQPKGLRKLVLASSIAVMQDWVDAGIKLQRGLSQDVQDTITKHEREGTTGSKEYEEAMGVFYDKHLCRIKPTPRGMVETFEWMAKDTTVYHTMNGPSEFFVTGPLKDFDITSELHKITAVTLITHGHYDGAQDSVVRKFFQYIPKVKWVEFAESSHTAHLEETERYLHIVGDFLSQE